MATGLGEARNVLVVRGGEVVVAVGGSWGTLSEIALARKMGREVLLLGDSAAELPLPNVDDPAEAAVWALAQIKRQREAGEATGLSS
jgi:predicted Rossmann-fold nucleotide-binding protein